MPKKLPNLIDAINEIKDESVKNSLRAASNHLTDLAIRNIVDYIRTLEEQDGKR